jgi:hypothetical protein
MDQDLVLVGVVLVVLAPGKGMVTEVWVSQVFCLGNVSRHSCNAAECHQDSNRCSLDPNSGLQTNPTNVNLHLGHLENRDSRIAEHNPN